MPVHNGYKEDQKGTIAVGVLKTASRSELLVYVLTMMSISVPEGTVTYPGIAGAHRVRIASLEEGIPCAVIRQFPKLKHVPRSASCNPGYCDWRINRFTC